jgi:curved DNA-binding protein CbpA
VTNPDHSTILRQGARRWNAWRADERGTVPDLRRLRLEPHEKNFGRGAGGPIDLHGANLEQADLSNAYLFQADFGEARLVDANLAGAVLAHADFSGADLTDATLSGADLSHTVFDDAVLAGADLATAKHLTQEQIERAAGDETTRLPRHLVHPVSWLHPAYGSWDEDEMQEPMAKREFGDLYEIIGARRHDSQETIQFLYRSKAKTLHPDLHPGDAEAEAAFHRLTHAYSILRDPEKRALYDRGEIGPDGEETVVYHRLSSQDSDMRRLKRYAAASVFVFLSAATVFGLHLSGLWMPFEEVRRVEMTDPSGKAMQSLPKPAEPQQPRSKLQERIVESERQLGPPEAGGAPAAVSGDAIAERGKETHGGTITSAVVPMQPTATIAEKSSRTLAAIPPPPSEPVVPMPPVTDAAKRLTFRSLPRRPYRCSPEDLQRARLQFDNTLRLDTLRCLSRLPARTERRLQPPGDLRMARP